MLVPLTALLVLTHEAKPEPAQADDRTPSRQLEGRAAMWPVAAVLGVWCVVQLVVVGGGAESVLKAENITPAEYARRGFFQLVAAAALSLAVLNGAHRLARSGSRPTAQNHCLVVRRG